MRRYVSIHPHNINNKKKSALYQKALNEWERVSLEDEITEEAFLKYVETVCERLNKQYPRCKTIGVYHHRTGEYISVTEIPYNSDNCSVLGIYFETPRKEYTCKEITEMLKKEKEGQA